MKLLVLVMLVICSGCTTFRPPEVRPVEIVTIEKPAPMYHPPLPPKIKSMPVQWKILTPDTMEEYLNDLKAGEAPVNAWYSLTVKGYENISNNMAQIQRYIRQVISIVEYYRDVDKARQTEDEEQQVEE
tara:strand:- start:418 stop:804 length:387 start_codon:yes stop_codon:yes gene_type:complete